MFFAAIDRIDSSGAFLVERPDFNEVFFLMELRVATECRKLFFGFAVLRDGGGSSSSGAGGGGSSGGAAGTALLVGIGPRNWPGIEPPYILR